MIKSEAIHIHSATYLKVELGDWCDLLKARYPLEEPTIDAACASPTTLDTWLLERTPQDDYLAKLQEILHLKDAHLVQIFQATRAFAKKLNVVDNHAMQWLEENQSPTVPVHQIAFNWCRCYPRILEDLQAFLAGYQFSRKSSHYTIDPRFIFQEAFDPDRLAQDIGALFRQMGYPASVTLAVTRQGEDIVLTIIHGLSQETVETYNNGVLGAASFNKCVNDCCIYTPSTRTGLSFD